MENLPADPLKQRELIRWVMKHPVWFVPVKDNRKNGFDFLPGMGWEECVDIDIAFVNPITRRIDDDDSLNTQFEVWIEAGPPVDISNEPHPPPPGGWNKYNRYARSHDFNLDCGGDTLQEAIMRLALLVKEHYGNYPQDDWGWLAWHKMSPHGFLYKDQK